jgi:hypothetical protein
MENVQIWTYIWTTRKVNAESYLGHCLSETRNFKRRTTHLISDSAEPHKQTVPIGRNSVADQDPGSGIGKKTRYGSGIRMNIPDHISES